MKSVVETYGVLFISQCTPSLFLLVHADLKNSTYKRFRFGPSASCFDRNPTLASVAGPNLARKIVALGALWIAAEREALAAPTGTIRFDLLVMRVH